MNIDNVPAFLKDFSISDDSEKPITSDLFQLKASESLKYTYTYHEMKKAILIIVLGLLKSYPIDYSRTGTRLVHIEIKPQYSLVKILMLA